jgi:hypothetical protein
MAHREQAPHLGGPDRILPSPRLREEQLRVRIEEIRLEEDGEVGSDRREKTGVKEIPFEEISHCETVPPNELLPESPEKSGAGVKILVEGNDRRIAGGDCPFQAEDRLLLLVVEEAEGMEDLVDGQMGKDPVREELGAVPFGELGRCKELE